MDQLPHQRLAEGLQSLAGYQSRCALAALVDLQPQAVAIAGRGAVWTGVTSAP